jgi:biotin transport system substrate-specific component
MNTPNLTLLGHLWPSNSMAVSLLRGVILAVLGSLLVAAAAHVSVPMLPVPTTLQTLAVLIIGGAFGARLGAATLALYAAEGAVGLPVFAPTPDGYPGITGPTAGYIFGFIIAAGVVGYLAQKAWDRNAFTALAAALIGGAIIYVPGLAWLYTFVGDLPKTLEYGLYPFVIGDVIKAVLAAIVFPVAWLALHRN